MRLRYTIRDVLWLTLVVALAVCWWLDRSALKRRVSELQLPSKVARLIQFQELLFLEEQYKATEVFVLKGVTNPDERAKAIDSLKPLRDKLEELRVKWKAAKESDALSTEN